MNKQLAKDGLLWGFLLWLFGYILGIIFFMIFPPALIGWFIMPIGLLASLWVLCKKIKDVSTGHLLKVAIIWTGIAIIFDYLFIVQMLKPADGYYKFDVYLYYVSTFALPLLLGGYKKWGKRF